MSKCPCKTTGVNFSLPGDAGLITTILPNESTLVLSFLSFANFRTYSAAFSSCLEGRGMLHKFSKCFQTICGFNSANLLAIINSCYFFKCN